VYLPFPDRMNQSNFLLLRRFRPCARYLLANGLATKMSDNSDPIKVNSNDIYYIILQIMKFLKALNRNEEFSFKILFVQILDHSTFYFCRRIQTALRRAVNK